MPPEPAIDYRQALRDTPHQRVTSQESRFHHGDGLFLGPLFGGIANSISDDSPEMAGHTLSILGDLSRKYGSKTIGDVFNKWGQSLIDYGQSGDKYIPEIGGFSDVDNPLDFMKFSGYLLGNGLASVGVVAGSGGLSGGLTYVAGKGIKYASKRAAQKAGGKSWDKFAARQVKNKQGRNYPVVAAGGGAFTASTVLNAGETRKQLIEEGVDEVLASEFALPAGLLMATLDFMPLAAGAYYLKRGAGKGAIKGAAQRLKRAGVGALAGSAAEGTTELLQGVIRETSAALAGGNAEIGERFERLVTDLYGGFLVGGGIGGAGSFAVGGRGAETDTEADTEPPRAITDARTDRKRAAQERIDNPLDETIEGFAPPLRALHPKIGADEQPRRLPSPLKQLPPPPRIELPAAEETARNEYEKKLRRYIQWRDKRTKGGRKLSHKDKIDGQIRFGIRDENGDLLDIPIATTGRTEPPPPPEPPPLAIRAPRPGDKKQDLPQAPLPRPKASDEDLVPLKAGKEEIAKYRKKLKPLKFKGLAGTQRVHTLTPDEEPLPAVLAIVPRASLATNSPAFQPRDRGTGTSDQQILEISNNLRPEELLSYEAGNAQAGPPTVKAETGEVLSGNGRIGGLRLAAKKGKVKPYEDELREMYPKQTKGVKAPTLVRVVAGLDDRAALAFAVRANKAQTMEYRPHEEAKIAEEVLLKSAEKRGVPSKGAIPSRDKEAIKAWLGSLGTARANAFKHEGVGKGGELNSAGERAYHDAYLVAAYNDPEQTQDTYGFFDAVLGEADSNSRMASVRNAMIDAAPMWLHLRAQNSEVAKKMRGDLIKALLRVKAYREAGSDESKTPLFNQGNLFDANDGDIDSLLDLFYKRAQRNKTIQPRSRDAMTKNLRELADNAILAGEEQGVLVEQVDVSPEAVMAKQADRVRSEDTGKEPSLFDDNRVPTKEEEDAARPATKMKFETTDSGTHTIKLSDLEKAGKVKKGTTAKASAAPEPIPDIPRHGQPGLDIGPQGDLQPTEQFDRAKVDSLKAELSEGLKQDPSLTLEQIRSQIDEMAKESEAEWRAVGMTEQEIAAAVAGHSREEYAAIDELIAERDGKAKPKKAAKPKPKKSPRKTKDQLQHEKGEAMVADLPTIEELQATFGDGVTGRETSFTERRHAHWSLGGGGGIGQDGRPHYAKSSDGGVLQVSYPEPEVSKVPLNDEERRELSDKLKKYMAVLKKKPNAQRGTEMTKLGLRDYDWEGITDGLDDPSDIDSVIGAVMGKEVINRLEYEQPGTSAPAAKRRTAPEMKKHTKTKAKAKKKPRGVQDLNASHFESAPTEWVAPFAEGAAEDSLVQWIDVMHKDMGLQTPIRVIGNTALLRDKGKALAGLKAMRAYDAESVLGHLNKVLNEMVPTAAGGRKKMGALMRLDTDYGPQNIFVIATDHEGDFTQSDFFYTVTHEFGHAMFKDAMKVAQENGVLWTDMQEAFNKFREGAFDMKMADFVREYFPLTEGSKTALLQNPDLTVADYAGSSQTAADYINYLLEFEEWFVQQAARWAEAEGSVPRTRLEQFFKDVADWIKRFISKQRFLLKEAALLARSKGESNPVPSVKNLLDTMVERAEGERASIKEYIKERRWMQANSGPDIKSLDVAAPMVEESFAANHIERTKRWLKQKAKINTWFGKAAHFLYPGVTLKGYRDYLQENYKFHGIADELETETKETNRLLTKIFNPLGWGTPERQALTQELRRETKTFMEPLTGEDRKDYREKMKVVRKARNNVRTLNKLVERSRKDQSTAKRRATLDKRLAALGEAEMFLEAKEAEWEAYQRGWRKEVLRREGVQQEKMRALGAKLGISKEMETAINALLRSKKRISETGTKWVELGLLDADVYTMNQRSYLRHIYADDIKGGRLKRRASNPFKARTLEDNDPERNLKGRLDELDIPLTIMQTDSELAAEAAQATMMNNLGEMSDRQGYGWFLPEDRVDTTYKGESVKWGVYFLASRRNQMQRNLDRAIREGGTEEMITALEEQVARWTKDLEEQAPASVRQQLERDPTKDPKPGALPSDIEKYYRRLPNHHSYGSQAGTAVRREIFEDIAWVSKLDEMDGLLGELSSGATRATVWWKMGKVPYNAPGVARNGMSNSIQAWSIAGVPIWKQPALVKSAYRQMEIMHSALKNGQNPDLVAQNAGVDIRAAKIFFRFGGKSSTRQAQEHTFAQATDHFSAADTLDIQAWRNPRKLLKSGMKWLGRKAQYIPEITFGRLEEISKVGIIQHYIDLEARGEPMADFDKNYQAEKAVHNYGRVPPIIDTARKKGFVLGAPFITYPYKMLGSYLRLLGETKINKDGKRVWVGGMRAGMTYALAHGGFLALRHAFDELDDTEDDRRKMPLWLQEGDNFMFPSTLTMPWQDAHGRRIVLDAGWVFPWYGFVRAAEKAGNLEPVNVFKELGVGGPVLDMVGAFLFNRNGFMQRDIMQEGQTRPQGYAAMGNYLWDMAVPSMLSANGPIMQIVAEALGENTDSRGQPRRTIAQNIARLMGANIHSYDPPEQQRRNIAAYDRELANIRKIRNRELKDESLTAQQRRDIALSADAFYREKLEERNAYILWMASEADGVAP